MNDDLVKQVKALETMDLPGLIVKYTEVYGVEPVGRRREVLRQQIQRKLQRMDIDRRKKERAKGAEAATEAPAPDAPRTVTGRLAVLTEMSLEDLRTEYQAVLGKSSRSRNRKQLIKRIADALQNDAYTEKMAAGAKPTLTVKFDRKKARSRRAAKPEKATESKRAQHRAPGQRDPRLPRAGTTIERVYKGKKLLVRVLDEGFEYEGKPYRSLSALAKHITGQIVNGFAWFRLGLPGKEKKSS